MWLGQAKLAKLRRELLDPAAGGGGGGGGRGDGFDVNKVGDARVGLVGKPILAMLNTFSCEDSTMNSDPAPQIEIVVIQSGRISFRR